MSDHSFLVSAICPSLPAFVFHEWLAKPSRLLLSGFTGNAVSLADAISITSVPISDDEMQVNGPQQNLTFGTEAGYGPSAASTGRIVLSSVSTSSQVWSVNIDQAGKAIHKPVQLTNESWSGAPSLSRDGEILALKSRRGEGWEIYSINMRSGKQFPVFSGAGLSYGQFINWTGTTIAYLMGPQDQAKFWQVPSSGGLPQRLLDEFFYPTDWSPDSRFLIGLVPGEQGRIDVKMLDVQTRSVTTLLSDRPRDLYQAHPSNDGNWLTFNAVSGTHSQLYIAPFRKSLVPQSEWIAITNASGWNDKPHFAYDDKVLFFTSDRDGHRCIWGQALQPDMHASGKPFPVYHSHQSRRSIGNVGIGVLELAVGPKTIMFNQQEFTGNVWLLDPKAVK